MKGFEANGRPIQTKQPAGLPTYPGIQGGTNWYSPSYSPRTKLMYVSTWESNAHIFGGTPIVYEPGVTSPAATIKRLCRHQVSRRGTFQARPDSRICGAAPSTTGHWTPAAASCRRSIPLTGDAKWKFEMVDVTDTGIFTTASDLLITGGREGYLQAFDARDGSLLWKTNLGAQMLNNPITYAVNGKHVHRRCGGAVAVRVRGAIAVSGKRPRPWALGFGQRGACFAARA